MNVEAYIASGILEAYAQGELSAAERAEVESNLARFPELRKELAAIEETQEALLQRVAIRPRDSVKTSILAAIDAKAGRKTVPLTSGAADRVWKLAAAAAVAIAVISSYLAYDYWNKWKKSEVALSELIARNQQVAEDYNNVNQRLDRMEQDLNVINNPAFQRIVMKGTDNAPSALASVYWNETTREVYLSIQEMKDLSAETQYQLWAIIDGKPVDAGVFDMTKGSLLRMRDIKGAATTFAVTIEPKGGKPAPSMETMQVAGNVVKG